MISEQEAKQLKIALLSAALVLCIAVLPGIAYGFYAFVRLVVCVVAGAAAFFLKGHPTLDKNLVPLVILAVLFNPLIPIFLGRALWIFIDIGTAAYFLTLSKKI